MTTPAHCLWCNRQTDELHELEMAGDESPVWACSAECEAHLRAFDAYARAHIWHFYLGLLLPWGLWGVLYYWMASIDKGALATALGFAGMGVAICIFPFTTPQTIEIAGLRNAIRVARILGGCLILGGAVSYFLIKAS